MCNRCSGWVHSKWSGLQNTTEYCQIKNWACSSCRSPPTPPITTKASDGDPFTILKFNANGIGNKQVELCEFLERHKIKVAVIQESKLALNSLSQYIRPSRGGGQNQPSNKTCSYCGNGWHSNGRQHNCPSYSATCGIIGHFSWMCHRRQGQNNSILRRDYNNRYNMVNENQYEFYDEKLHGTTYMRVVNPNHIRAT